MFEFRVYSPNLKTTFFYGREPSFEQAWDKAVVYILNDDRWKDQSNIINAINSTETDPNHERRGLGLPANRGHVVKLLRG
jgi:hypothetical protein